MNSEITPPTSSQKSSTGHDIGVQDVASSREPASLQQQLGYSLGVPLRISVCLNTLIHNPPLRNRLIAPVLVGIGLWLFSTILLFIFRYELIEFVYPLTPSWWKSVLLGILSVLLGFLAAPLGIIATSEYLLDSFINESLAILHPKLGATAPQTMWKTAFRSILIIICKLIVLFGLAVLALFSLVIPGLGIILLLCTALFAATDALLTVGMCRGDGIRKTLSLVSSNYLYILTLGLFLSVLYSIPILNLFTPYLGYMLAADFKGSISAKRPVPSDN